jgi:hypothetical protein
MGESLSGKGEIGKGKFLLRCGAVHYSSFPPSSTSTPGVPVLPVDLAVRLPRNLEKCRKARVFGIF